MPFKLSYQVVLLLILVYLGGFEYGKCATLAPTLYVTQPSFSESAVNLPAHSSRLLPATSQSFSFWGAQIGSRLTILREKVSTVNQVVLVPDEATFVSAIAELNLQGRWPILIEDDFYTPMFLRRFQPEEVICLPSVKETSTQGYNRQEQL